MNALENIAEELAEQITELVMPRVLGKIKSFEKQSAKFCWSEKEAAELLDCSVETMRRRRKAKEIDYSMSPASKPVYMAHHLLDYLARHEVRNGAQKVSLKDMLAANGNLVNIHDYKEDKKAAA